MFRLSLITSLIVAAVMTLSSSAFTTPTHYAKSQLTSSTFSRHTTSVNMGFGLGDEPPKKLTRDNEPDEYFTSKMDKMSDEEKLPIALMGLAGISLPFILGLIALYAAK